MGSYAYDCLVGELIIRGINPTYAVRLAGYFEPEEILEFRNKQELNFYTE